VWVCSYITATTLDSHDESLTRFVQQSRFDEKKAKFAEHTGLFLNKWFTGKTRWTDDEIRERGERFADVAVSRWIGLDGS